MPKNQGSESTKSTKALLNIRFVKEKIILPPEPYIRNALLNRSKEIKKSNNESKKT